MTEGFQTVLAASDEERRDPFVGAADRLLTNEQNIEKDFWVRWTLRWILVVKFRHDGKDGIKERASQEDLAGKGCAHDI